MIILFVMIPQRNIQRMAHEMGAIGLQIRRTDSENVSLIDRWQSGLFDEHFPGQKSCSGWHSSVCLLFCCHLNTIFSLYTINFCISNYPICYLHLNPKLSPLCGFAAIVRADLFLLFVRLSNTLSDACDSLFANLFSLFIYFLIFQKPTFFLCLPVWITQMNHIWIIPQISYLNSFLSHSPPNKSGYSSPDCSISPLKRTPAMLFNWKRNAILHLNGSLSLSLLLKFECVQSFCVFGQNADPATRANLILLKWWLFLFERLLTKLNGIKWTPLRHCLPLSPVVSNHAFSPTNCLPNNIHRMLSTEQYYTFDLML